MTSTPHDTDVIELFEKVTVALPGSTDLRVIKLEGFAQAIEQMMNKAYYMGCQQSLNSAETIIERVFNRQL